MRKKSTNVCSFFHGYLNSSIEMQYFQRSVYRFSTLQPFVVESFHSWVRLISLFVVEARGMARRNSSREKGEEGDYQLTLEQSPRWEQPIFSPNLPKQSAFQRSINARPGSIYAENLGQQVGHEISSDYLRDPSPIHRLAQGDRGFKPFQTLWIPPLIIRIQNYLFPSYTCSINVIPLINI